MTTWMLVIFIASDMWLPHATFNSKIECRKYIETLQELHQLTPGQFAVCLPGTVEEKTTANAKHRLGLPR
jgi:hypothetical protein